MRTTCTAALVSGYLLLSANGSLAQSDILIGAFSQGKLDGWETESFKGETTYRFTRSEETTVLEAISNQAASGLVMERDIDLQKTPIISWSWKIEKTTDPALDERTKDGDDFAVRLYFVTPGSGLFSFPDSVSYVWASRQKVYDAWPNPYTSKVRMIAVDSGPRHVGTWRHHRRNMREDFREQFGRDITKVTHIAIMTDTDNSSGSAHSWYGDIMLHTAP